MAKKLKNIDVRDINDIPENTPHQESDVIERPKAPIPTKLVSDLKGAPEIEGDKPIAETADKTGKKKSKRKALKRNKILVMLAVIVIVSVAAVLIWRPHSNKVASKCPQALLKQAADNLDPTKVANLQKVVDQIKTIPGYDKDASCMYVVTTYYANISDADNATKSLAAFNKASQGSGGKSGQQLSPALKTNSSSSANLSSTVKTVQTQNDQTSPYYNAYGVDDNDQVVHVGASQ